MTCLLTLHDSFIGFWLNFHSCWFD
jgi:hypothetical protein